MNVKKILEILDTYYPYDHKCFLDYKEPWQLLVATILSAQCTDDRVNKITADLFQKYTSLEAIASADFDELSLDVRTAGFFRMKAKHIIESTGMLLSVHNGQMPSDIDQLTALPGVGRKTANVLRGHIFKIPCVVVDTHVKRVTNRLGLTENTDPVKIEFDLMKVLPEESWIAFNAQIITHGRRICFARSPKCKECPLRECCAHLKTVKE